MQKVKTSQLPSQGGDAGWFKRVAGSRLVALWAARGWDGACGASGMVWAARGAQLVQLLKKVGVLPIHSLHLKISDSGAREGGKVRWWSAQCCTADWRAELSTALEFSAAGLKCSVAASTEVTDVASRYKQKEVKHTVVKYKYEKCACHLLLTIIG